MKIRLLPGIRPDGPENDLDKLTRRKQRRRKRGTHSRSVTDLEPSHAELRAALIIAGRHIRKLSFGRKNDPVLAKMREVLRDARSVSRRVYRVPLEFAPRP